MVATAVFTDRIVGDQPAAADTEFAVAGKTLDVTPKAPPWPSLWMAGYGWVPRGSTNGAYARKLRAHCLAIFDNGVPNVMLRLDVVGIPRDVHQEIRRRVVEEEGLVTSSDFLIAASHTHSGPQIGDTHCDPYVLMNLTPADIGAINGSTWLLMDLLVDLVRRTVRDATRFPVTLHYAEGSAAISFNRTGPLDTVIPDVPVLLARNAGSGTPLILLFGYACHPVSRGNDTIFDSDYVGVAAESIERQLGITAMFFQGASGDLNPISGGPVTLGERLATAVVNVVRNGTFTPVTGPIRTALIEVDLPFAVDTTDPGAVAALRRKYESRLDGHLGQAEVRHAQVTLRQIRDGQLAQSVPMPIQCWKFGGLTVLALAHEVLSTYHVLLKDVARRLGTGNLWIMAYANETQCYVPADDIFWAGGYEAGWRDGDRTIVGAGSNMLAYTWPAPLRSSEPGTDPTDPNAAEGKVMAACEDLLL